MFLMIGQGIDRAKKLVVADVRSRHCSLNYYEQLARSMHVRRGMTQLECEAAIYWINLLIWLDKALLAAYAPEQCLLCIEMLTELAK